MGVGNPPHTTYNEDIFSPSHDRKKCMLLGDAIKCISNIAYFLIYPYAGKTFCHYIKKFSKFSFSTKNSLVVVVVRNKYYKGVCNFF